MTHLEQVLDTVKKRYPDKAPDKELSPYELGLIVGQQQTIRAFETAIEKAQEPPHARIKNKSLQRRP